MSASDTIKQLSELLKDPDFMDNFEKSIRRKHDRKLKNIERIKTFFNDQESFNNLVNNILDKHNQEYSERCYKNGYMPHPLNILYSLFELADSEGEPIEPFDQFTIMFPSSATEYMNWQFVVTHGQGSVCSVYYKNELKYRD